MEILCHFREIQKKGFLQPSKAKRKLNICYNKAMENKKKLLLIDGSSVAYRAFFALYNQIDNNNRRKNPDNLSNFFKIKKTDKNNKESTD